MLLRWAFIVGKSTVNHHFQWRTVKIYQWVATLHEEMGNFMGFVADL
jgi:hypothetical protein